MPTEVRFTGGPALERALRDLGAETAGRLGLNAVRAGARVIAARARALAPVQTGELKKSIRIFDDRELNKQKRNQRAAHAGTRLFYASLVEFGTVHTSPKGFMRAASDEGAQDAVNKLKENLGAGITRETQKYAGR